MGGVEASLVVVFGGAASGRGVKERADQPAASFFPPAPRTK